MTPAMRTAVAWLGAVGLVVVMGGAAACAGSGSADTSTDLSDAGLPDALVVEGGGQLPEAAPPVTDAEPDAADKVAPTTVTDLAASAAGATSVTLTWTAPSDDSGSAALYDIRRAATAMTSEAELLAGTQVTGGPKPGATGTTQTATVTGLTAETAYHFALRARDATGNWSAVSNDAVVTTKARATFQISEVAISNATANGFDFVELTATKAGAADGIEVRQLTTVLHTLGALDVAVGDRVVVHLTALPGPTGFAQEDATKNKTASTAAFASATAYDVYSATNGLTATDGIVSVADAGTTLDAVVFANRDNGVATATMTALAAAKTDGAWVFAVTPADGVNDCDTETDAVNVATSATETICGGFKSPNAPGFSLNRRPSADTNTKADFYFAPQTPGADNAPIPAPTVTSAGAASDTTVDLAFDQEIAPGTVAAGAFSIAGVTVNTAAASFNHVALTTTTQSAGTYDVVIAPTVTNLQGVAPVPLTARFCGFSSLPALLTLSEVNSNLAGGADLIELTVTRAGSLGGFTLRSGLTMPAGTSGALLATLPAICGAVGDIVVVHLVPGAAPGASETASKTQFDNATYSQNYDTAWDVLGASTGLGPTTVITIRNPDGTYLEAVAFQDGGNAATTAGYKSGLIAAQAQGLWLPADCGGAACSDASAPTARSIGASWAGLAATPSGNSVHRVSAATDASAWAVGRSSFGVGN
jgi:hypothetical protein